MSRRNSPSGRGARLPARGPTTPGGSDLTRTIDAPASAVFTLLTDPARRGWSPAPVMRVLSALAPRFARLALPDGTTVGISIVRQGNSRCSVTVELTALPPGADVATVRHIWRGALAALADQLDHDWG